MRRSFKVRLLRLNWYRRGRRIDLPRLVSVATTRRVGNVRTTRRVSTRVFPKYSPVTGPTPCLLHHHLKVVRRIKDVPGRLPWYICGIWVEVLVLRRRAKIAKIKAVRPGLTVQVKLHRRAGPNSDSRLVSPVQLSNYKGGVVAPYTQLPQTYVGPFRVSGFGRRVSKEYRSCITTSA